MLIKKDKNQKQILESLNTDDVLDIAISVINSLKSQVKVKVQDNGNHQSGTIFVNGKPTIQFNEGDTKDEIYNSFLEFIKERMK